VTADRSNWSLLRVLELIHRFTGSPAAPDRVTAGRIGSGLLVMVLAARVVHVAQALVDVTIGGPAYTHPRAAFALAMTCLAESAVLAAVLLRRGELTVPPLVFDTAFGVGGLAGMSYAMGDTSGRSSSLNWMLPYSVGTAAALGLAVTGRFALAPGQDSGTGELQPGRQSGRRIPPVLMPVALMAVLTAAYVVFQLVPRPTDASSSDIVANAANYPLFFLGAAALARSLRRRLDELTRRNAQAQREAAAVARAAQERLVLVDVFGPVFDLLDETARLEGPVPPPLQKEAGRLIDLIDALHSPEPFREQPDTGAAKASR
jgi:hypothetical protein